MTNSNILLSSESNEHYTPKPIVEAARDLFGGTIDLDPFSNQLVNEKLIKATQFFDKDGFNSDNYHGNMFVNPPGGCVTWDKEQQRWISAKRGKSSLATAFDSVKEAYDSGSINSCVFVAFSLELLTRRPEALDYPICFINGYGNRQHPEFIKPSGRLCYTLYNSSSNSFIPETSPTHGSFIIYFPERKEIIETQEAEMIDVNWKLVFVSSVYFELNKDKVTQFYKNFSQFGTVGEFSN